MSTPVAAAPSTVRRVIRALVATSLVGVVIAAVSVSAGAAEAPVGLGTATSFAVLGGQGVTNTGSTTVDGDLGTCPNASVTGFPPGTVTNGTINRNNALACGAQSDLTIAYDDAAGRAPNTTYPGPTELGGRTLLPGVYRTPSSFQITGALTLDGANDPDAVWIFQSASTLTTATDSDVGFIRMGQACNVFWQVGSSATLGVDSTFAGTILALTSITANTSADIDGRLLARNGSVTLDTDDIDRPFCAAAVTTTSAGPTTSSTTTPGTSSTTSTTTGAATSTTSTTTAAATTTITSQPIAGATTPTTARGTVTGIPVIGGTTTGGSTATGRTTTGISTNSGTTTPRTDLARTGTSVDRGTMGGLLLITLGSLLVLLARSRRRPVFYVDRI